jgi:hypothetical protein
MLEVLTSSIVTSSNQRKLSQRNFHFHSFTMTILRPFLLLSILHQTTANPSHAISSHKAPNPSTPSEIAIAWAEKDAALHAYIEKSVPAVLEHTGSEAFDAHLRGVQGVLREWGADEYLCNAGLFHSICECFLVRAFDVLMHSVFNILLWFTLILTFETYKRWHRGISRIFFASE